MLMSCKDTMNLKYIIESLNWTAVRALEPFLAASCIELRAESNENTPGPHNHNFFKAANY